MAPTQPVLTLQAQMQALRPLPRFLTDIEVVIFAEAEAAGAVIVPRLLREFLSGVQVWPIQFEGCWVHAEDLGDARTCAAADEAKAKRDAFWDRVRSGDLRKLILGDAQRKAA